MREVARRYRSELPPPRGLRHRLKVGFSRIMMAVVMRLPVPSEVKWQYSLDFIRTMTVEHYQSLAHRFPETQARAEVARVLSTSGSRWMWDVANKHHTSARTIHGLADMMSLLFRTLNIDSSVEVRSGEVVVVNHRCPYLARGLDRGIRGDRLCDMMCGGRTSLLEGVTLGLPTVVHYRSETMMGHGDKTCVKRLSDPLGKMK